MARYEIMRPCYVRPDGESNVRLVAVGEVIEFSDPPSRAMKPLDEAAEQASRRAGSGWEAGSIASAFSEHRTPRRT